MEIKTIEYVNKVAWVGANHFASSGVIDKCIHLWHTSQPYVPVGTLRSMFLDFYLQLIIFYRGIEFSLNIHMSKLLV